MTPFPFSDPKFFILSQIGESSVLQVSPVKRKFQRPVWDKTGGIRVFGRTRENPDFWAHPQSF